MPVTDYFQVKMEKCTNHHALMIQERLSIAVGSERYLDCAPHTSLCVRSSLDNSVPPRPLTISHYTHNAKYVQTQLSDFLSQQRQRICPCCSKSRPALGPTQHHMQWLSVLFPGGKATAAWSCAEVNNGWRCTSTPPCTFMVWCKFTHCNNCTFPLHSLMTTEKARSK